MEFYLNKIQYLVIVCNSNHHLNRRQSVCYSDPHLNSGQKDRSSVKQPIKFAQYYVLSAIHYCFLNNEPFNDRTHFFHLNTGLACYSNPHYINSSQELIWWSSPVLKFSLIMPHTIQVCFNQTDRFSFIDNHHPSPLLSLLDLLLQINLFNNKNNF